MTVDDKQPPQIMMPESVRGDENVQLFARIAEEVLHEEFETLTDFSSSPGCVRISLIEVHQKISL